MHLVHIKYKYFINISPHQKMTQSLKNQIFLLFDNINYLNFVKNWVLRQERRYRCVDSSISVFVKDKLTLQNSLLPPCGLLGKEKNPHTGEVQTSCVYIFIYFASCKIQNLPKAASEITLFFFKKKNPIQNK